MVYQQYGLQEWERLQEERLRAGSTSHCVQSNHPLRGFFSLEHPSWSRKSTLYASRQC